MSLVGRQGDALQTASGEAPKIEFPCENYLIKVVSLHTDDLLETLVSCVRQHDPELDESIISQNASSKGRFVSFSFRILATSEQQLSSLHTDLMAIETVKMVL